MNIDESTLMKVDEALWAVIKYYQEVAPEKWPEYSMACRRALVALRKETGYGHAD